MSKSPPNLAETLEQAWDLLSPNNAKRIGVLASLDETGAPQARSVALCESDRARGVIAMRADYLSCKIEGLKTDPRVSYHLWMPDELVQLRLSGTATITAGPDVRRLWDQVAAPSREAYGHVPAPGTPISDSDAWSIEPSPDRFAVLGITLAHIDAVSLDPKGHRRAEFLRSDDWQGQWLSP